MDLFDSLNTYSFFLVTDDDVGLRNKRANGLLSS
jgi:hypothetical protein